MPTITLELIGLVSADVALDLTGEESMPNIMKPSVKGNSYFVYHKKFFNIVRPNPQNILPFFGSNRFL